jgi:hypothetical protein
MLQRIQSLYWLGATICLSFLNFGLNVFTFESKDGVYEFDFYKLVKFEAGKVVSEKMIWIYPATLFFTVLIVVAIFLFKKLKVQYRLSNRIKVGLTFMLFVLTLNAYMGIFVNNTESVVLGPGYFFFVLAIIFCYLASWGVKKDKKLLDSVDRIR